MIINGHALSQIVPPIITPQAFHKVRPEGHLTSWGRGEAGYDIRIKQEIRFAIFDGIPQIAIVHPDGRCEQNYGRFCLASSVEHFHMPNSLVGIGHDKSTLARLGVQVFNTVIEPGWKGYLTIELVFNGEDPVHIPAGSGIMQVLFHQLACEAQYGGKYQDQPNEPVSAKA